MAHLDRVAGTPLLEDAWKGPCGVFRDLLFKKSREWIGHVLESMF
jgi:hypothetical protein